MKQVSKLTMAASAMMTSLSVLTVPAFAYTPLPGSDAPNLVNGWYQVSTPQQLEYIDQNQASYLSANIELMNNIDLSGYAGWVPFGGNQYNLPFSGTFNGQGFEIQNLTIHDTTDSSVGLFGIATGTVENVGVDATVLGGIKYQGGLVGYQVGGTISDSYATGSVSGSGGYYGGLVGEQDGGTIGDSYATGDVSGGSSSINGGLVGSQNGSSCTISDSYAAGDVSGGSGSSNGGLVGFQELGTISDSYAIGSVSGSDSFNGGLVGVRTYGHINASFYDTTTAKLTKGAGLGSSSGAGLGSLSGITGEPTAQMQSSSTFTNAGWNQTTQDWAFNYVDQYPLLTWQTPLFLSMAISQATVGPGATITVTGSVRGPDGVPAANINVVFNAILKADEGQGSPPFVGQWDQPIVVTDSNGNFRNFWTAPGAPVNAVLTAAVEGAFTDLVHGVSSAETYTVTYNGNGNTGGQASVDSNMYFTGALATVSDNTGNLAKTGYTFAGWNTQADGSGTNYVPGSTIASTNADVMLYAQWAANPETATWSGVGSGSNAPGHVKTLLYSNGTLYAGVDSGSPGVWSYDTTAANASWTQMSGSPGAVGSLADVNGTLYAGTHTGSNDVWMYSGGAWTQVGVNQSHTPGDVNSLVYMNNTLYASGGSPSVVWMYSGGQWSLLSGSPPYGVSSLVVENGTLYAIGLHGSPGTGSFVYVYNTTSNSWNVMDGSLRDVSSLVAANGTLYASTYSSGVYVYDTTGASPMWRPYGNSPHSVTSLVFDAQSGSLYVSSDNQGLQSALIAAPAAPANVQTNNTTATSAALTWSPVPGLMYSVYENGGGTPIATGITGGSYTVTGLHPGTPYTLTVSAANAIGESAHSAVMMVNTEKIGSVQLTANSLDVLSGHTVSVSGVVYDVYGQQPVANSIVDFSSPIGTWGTSGKDSESVTADVYGAIATTWTAPTVTSDQSVTVTASVYGTVYGAVPNVTPIILSWNVAPPPTVSTTTLPGATAGTSYAQTLSGMGGFAPYTWSIAGGALPAGLSLDASTGVISGTPAAAGSSSFTVKLTDKDGNTATQGLSITVATLPTVSTPPTLPPHSGGSTSGGSPSGSTSGGSTGIPSTPPVQSPALPTIVTSQTFDNTGGSIDKTVGGIGIQIAVPEGAFAQSEQLTVTLGTPINVTQSVSGLNKSNIALVLGVSFSGASPTKPVTVTVTNPSIAAGGVVYKLTSSGELIPLQAQVSAGQAVVSFTSDPDFVVLNVKANERVITMAGHASIVPAVVHSDGGVQTTYMPIWYVMQLLEDQHISSTWDGHNWHLTTAGQLAADSGKVGMGSMGSMHIYVNGTLVQNVNGLYAKDPSTDRNTTFMPIWYVQQILQKLGLQNTWNGTTWSLMQ